jgi:hypothetical protein
MFIKRSGCAVNVKLTCDYQATFLDSGKSDLSVPFDFGTSYDNPQNPANTPRYTQIYGERFYDL